MTHEEFMKLPLESRKKIEATIVDLNQAVENVFGISMLSKHTTVSGLGATGFKPTQTHTKSAKGGK